MIPVGGIILDDFPDTQPSLIARVKDLGDGASWAEFLGIYQPIVFRMARRRGMQEADALDVMQQVFLSIARSIENWTAEEGRPPFRAWLSTIAKNAITKALARRPRDAATGASSVIDLLHEVPSADDATEELVAEARHEVVRWAAQQLRSEFSFDTWNIFWQTAIEGVPAAEVAKAMGRSPGAIYVARYRVLTRLKEKVLEVSNHWDI
jgi:RNA polymerase sigma-70 factor (ECF subfamily)